MSNQIPLYKVEFKEPPIMGDDRTEFYFTSLSAIYGKFEAEQIGCKASRLWNIGVAKGRPYNGRLCRVTRCEAYRSSQNATNGANFDED